MENPSQATSSKTTRRLTIIGAIALIIILILLLITSYLLYQSRTEYAALQNQVSSLQQEAAQKEQQAKNLEGKIKNLVDTQAEVLRTTARILDAKHIQNVKEEVDWNATLEQLVDLEPGNRKIAVFTSILLAIKEMPFTLGGRSPKSGFDSPGFGNYVLKQSGVELKEERNQFLSVSMMNQLKATEQPRPGDLMFFEGSTGNFVLFYLGTGKDGGPGVGAGHLNSNMLTGIYDTKQFSGKFKGYYQVQYPDEP